MTLANKMAFFLMGTVVVFTTLAYGTVHQPTLSLFYFAVTLVVLLWATDGMLSGTVRISNSLLQVPLLAAAVYGIIQVIPFGTVTVDGVTDVSRTLSLDPFATQANALHFLFLFLFLAVSLVLLDSAKRIQKAVALVTVFGTLYAFFAILQSVLSPDKIYGIYERAFAVPFGSFVSRHNFAAYMEMTIALPLGLLFAGAVGRDKRLLYVTAIALMGTALLLSGSRGGLIALIAEVAFMLMLTMRSKSGNVVGAKIALAAVLLLVIVGGSFFVGGESSLTRIAETQSDNSKAIDRAYIWGVTLNIIRVNMPFGAGFGAYGVAFTPFDKYSGMERVEQAHNDYLQVVSDAGLVGLAIGSFFLFALFKVGRGAVGVENTFRRGVAIGALSGIFAILVHSVFDFVLHTTAISVLFLTLVALVAASGVKYADDVEELEQSHRRRRPSAKMRSLSPSRASTRH